VLGKASSRSIAGDAKQLERWNAKRDSAFAQCGTFETLRAFLRVCRDEVDAYPVEACALTALLFAGAKAL
jgi:hypothetical protein